MNRKALGIVLLGLGVVLVIAGIVVIAVVVPSMKQFPDNVDTTRIYTGDMPVLFNPDTFQFMKDLKIDLTRHFKTEAVDGGTALVFEEQTLSSGGQTLEHFIKRYAIDRKTMESVSSYPASWATKDGFWPRQGLVLGWPIDTKKQGYKGWSDDYRKTIDFKFEGEEKHGGINTYLFTTSSGPQPIDPAQVAVLKLPTALPKAQFQSLVEAADVSAVIKAAVPLILSKVEGDSVPLKYYYEYQGQYWVEPRTGVLIDTKKHELRTVGLTDEVLAAIPIFANMTDEQKAAARVVVSDFTYQDTDQTLKDAKKDAQDAITQIQVYGTILPIIAIVMGVVLGLLGAFLFTRKSPPAAAA